MDAVDFQNLTTFFFKVTQSFLNLWFMLTSESRVEILFAIKLISFSLEESALLSRGCECIVPPNHQGRFPGVALLSLGCCVCVAVGEAPVHCKVINTIPAPTS